MSKKNMISRSKKILVTGGAGFIGINLSEMLLGEGFEVYVLDNFYSSARSNVARFQDNPAFHLIEHDITTPLLLTEKFDRIYHLACPASPPWYQKEPIKTIRTNVEGSMHVLDLARRSGARILQASTSEVYGDPLEHPQKEEYRGNVSTLGPRACYDEGKRLVETVFMEYYREYGVDIRIVRIFNTYGPSMSPGDGRVVSNFIVQALRGDPLTIYGDGNQTRSFQYISDLLRGMRALMDTEGVTGPINIGNPSEVTVNELAQKIIFLTDSKSKIVHKPLPTDDPRQRCPDISLAKERLGWTPLVELEVGLKKTIDYFREIEDSRS